MYKQTPQQKAKIMLKKIRIEYKAGKLTAEQRRWLESGIEKDL